MPTDRRLYPPEFEAKKRAQSKNLRCDSKPDQVYVFRSGEAVFYVGTTFNPVSRFKRHRKAIEKGKDQKTAYVWARACGLDNVEMIVVDPLGEQTEAEWKRHYTSLGHVLANDVECVDVKRKQPFQKVETPKVVHCAAFKKLMKG